MPISRSHLDREHDPLLRPRQHVVRLPRIDVGRLEMRDVSQTSRLIELGYEAGREAVQAEAVAAVPRARRTG